MHSAWPPLPYEPWRETAEALHLWTQVVGKYRLAHTPWINHSWHATLYVTSCGLTTGAIHDGPHAVMLTFDLLAHRLVAETSEGRREAFRLGPMSVAEFFERTRALIAAVGGRPILNGRPNELPSPVPFAEDHARRPYDGEAAVRFHRVLLSVERVFSRFRTGFLGKVSPAHLFWGSFDLAVTRFSGRQAPAHPGGIPNLPDAVTREAYSHEVSSAGFWPGAGAGEPMFYSYAYPKPEGFAGREIRPAAARWDAALGEFLLPYEAVRSSDDPEAALLEFLHSTYEAAAEAAGWDRASLECDLGTAGTPRQVPVGAAASDD